MGFTYANIKLINTDDIALVRNGYKKADETRNIDLNILVDSGAIDLCINEEIRIQLELELVEKTTARMADGSLIPVEIVGPVTVKFLNRQTTVNAVVLPGNVEPLFGVIPLEGMDVIIDPIDQQLKLPPSRPNKAVHALHGLRR
jgi:clan AA aspartic protease